MKITSNHHCITAALIGCACIAATTSTAMAQNNPRAADPTTPRSPTTTRSQTDRAGAQVENVRVTRASNFLGADVIATDDRKVGDIVDYYFDLGSSPHLAYVVVMTGGFLDMGGDRRAVPASAITATGDNCRINVSSQQFWDVPVLPENRQRFISDPQHQQRISQLFRESGQTASATRDPSRTRGSQTTDTTRTTTPTDTTRATPSSSATARTDDPSRPGAMTGRQTAQGEQRLVSFSELRNADAYGQQDTRLGFFADAWINLNDNRAPYVEITPTFQPFRTNFDRRYAVPTAKLAQKREFYGYSINITQDELNQAEPVSETEGVKMLEEGRFGNAVLRVTVPEKSERDNRR